MNVHRIAASAAMLLVLTQHSSVGATRIACTGSEGERALTSAHFVHAEGGKIDLGRSMQDFVIMTGSTIYRTQVTEAGRTDSKNEFHLLRSDQAVEIEIVAETGEREISVQVSRACRSRTSTGWGQYWAKFTAHLRQQGFRQSS
jgi:hypothetical protein